MTPERWGRVKELFEAALEQEGSARLGFVAQAAADDPTLADEVLRMLASDEKAGEFLSGVIEGTLPRLASSGPLPGPVDRHIGPYRLVGEIGHGGMGAVYRAVRDDDQYQKRVAIKLLREATGSDLVIERFKAERQILANLEHPNIARLIDGGTTEEGWQYFSMECVDGEPIDQHCDSHNLSTRQRLELFVTVCSAVQYAHQRLVVHRDLKPSNILVSQEGMPKLLDFGIAKLLTDTGPAKTLTGFVMMTPEYASPEQVKGAPITTASDIYSLGMLLYELLARRRAYQIQSGSPVEIARVVCQVEPEKPSAVAPRSLARQLAGDLDTIVLKAIRKESTRRYASVQELSDDIRRHLSGRPVLARADTLGYRAGKFVGRHRLGVAGAALVLLSIVGGMVATLRQARIAEANRARAEKRFADVRKLANWVVFDMYDAIAKLPGSTPARKQLVEKALDYLDSLASETTDPVLEAEIARGYEQLAEVQGDRSDMNLGDTDRAIASMGKAIALRERLARGPPADSRVLAQLAQSHARLLYILPGGEARKTLLEKMKSVLDPIAPRDSEDETVLKAWMMYFAAKGNLEAEAYDLTALRETRRRQVEVTEKILALHPADVQSQHNLSLGYKQYGAVLQALKQPKAARELYDKALAMDRKIVEAEPSHPQHKLDLSFSYGSIGSLLREDGDFDEALAAHQTAFELRQAVYAADPKNKFALHSLVWGHKSIAGVLADKGDLPGAISREREGLKLRETWENTHPSAHGKGGWQASFHSSVADHRVRIASQGALPAASRLEHWRRAREDYSKALAFWLERAKRMPLRVHTEDVEGSEGDYAENPEGLQKAIARCDEALAKLGHR